MPVHLGSMGESIKTVIRENAGSMQPGDVYVLNDPYHGGTHLPDITVITPVYLGTATQPTFYVGSRGHHADIGGITPGSMPPFSTLIEEEGVQINNVKLVERGVLREAEMIALLKSGKYPSRNPQQNMADLKAQIAANEKGVQELRKMVDSFSLDVVLAYMRHVQDNAEESVRRVITRLKDGEFTCRWTTARRSRWRSASMPRAAAPRSISPAPRRSRATTSTRRRRCAWRRCCMCSARWWTTTSR
jgi:5-oxoprolinase (ATP-hydrolysing)